MRIEVVHVNETGYAHDIRYKLPHEEGNKEHEKQERKSRESITSSARTTEVAYANNTWTRIGGQLLRIV